ncbi:hypothetical protein LCGC14_0476450 [marine sediment metagenome]|uniref:Uncharacterized protein n=1 Tax=marine sediment metagenome TaxID=412755 RepID=A0A0F9STJ2_9ZZZZ
MATEEWKKTGKSRWKKGNKVAIVLDAGSADGKIKGHAFWLIGKKGIIKERKFKTKSLALKFARDFRKKK